MTEIPLDERSLYLRRLVVRALVNGGRGHVGPAMSLIEIMRVLYDDVLRYRADDPAWAERDRCILSKGHGCLALYAVLADKGFFPVETLDTFCRTGSILGGHPEHGKVPGVEASTGSLGHGLSIGLGMALALRYSVRQGLMNGQDAERAARLLETAGLVTQLKRLPGGPYPADTLTEAMKQDKKARAGRVPLILARGLGRAFIQPDADLSDVRDFLNEELQQG